MRRLYILLLLIFISIIAFQGCKQKEQRKNQTQDIAVATRFSISKPPLKERDPGTKYSYKLQPNEAFKGTYEVKNINPKKQNYLLLAFLDYKQAPITLEGKKALDHKIILGSNQDKCFSFYTEPIKEGFHDYSMLLIWFPQKHRLDDKFRTVTNCFLGSNRASLLVGNNITPPNLTITKPTFSAKQDELGSDFDGIIVNKEKTKQNFWTKEVAKPKQEIPYFIHVANNSKKTKKYALVVLLDYKQIPLTLNGKEGTFVEIKPNEFQSFTASFKAPSEKGIHELQIIRMASPNVKLREYHDDDFIIDASIRTAIIVK